MGGYSSVCSACSILINDYCTSGLDMFLAKDHRCSKHIFMRLLSLHEAAQLKEKRVPCHSFLQHSEANEGPTLSAMEVSYSLFTIHCPRNLYKRPLYRRYVLPGGWAVEKKNLLRPPFSPIEFLPDNQNNQNSSTILI